MAKKNALTYGELTGALRELKYSRDPRQSGDTYSVYHRRGRPLRIILPALEERTPMRGIYVAAVRRTLEENNPTDAEKFVALLNGHGSRKQPVS